MLQGQMEGHATVKEAPQAQVLPALTSFARNHPQSGLIGYGWDNPLE